jgi:hypothetical protein
MVARSTAAATGVDIKLDSNVFVSCRPCMESMLMAKSPVEQVMGIIMSGLMGPN